MKTTLLGSALSFLNLTKAHRLFLPLFGGIGTILVLHRVLPETGLPRIKANSRIEITPTFLEQLIEFFLNNNYDIISLDSLYDYLSQKKTSRRFICFTFDDGYTDAYEIVYPIFKKYNSPFCVYLTTCFPEKTALPWWYMLEDLVQNNNKISFTHDSQEYIFDSSTISAKENTFNTIRAQIMSVPYHKAENFIQSIFTSYDISVRDYDSYLMNWDQVRDLTKDPLVTIGAHTVNHFNLTQLTAEKVEDEILHSKTIIEQNTGTLPLHFAYPFGSNLEVSQREIDIASRCGFKTMTTVREGNIFPAHADYLDCLPRIEVTGRHQNLTLVDMRRSGVLAVLRNGIRHRVISG